jgi:hypothetical protein
VPIRDINKTVDPIGRSQDGDRTFLSVHYLLYSRGKFILRFCAGGFISMMWKELRFVAGHPMLENLFLLPTQDVHKLAGKCNPISLLGGIKQGIHLERSAAVSAWRGHSEESPGDQPSSTCCRGILQVSRPGSAAWRQQPSGQRRPLRQCNQTS